MAVADFVYEKKFKLANSVVPLLSVVVGLMLVFRNTTAFARWDEGRKSFTALQSIVRNLARDYWISIGGPIPGQEPDTLIIPSEEVRIKARCLRLMVAFVVAVKRHVRGQYGIEYEDLKALLPLEFYKQVDTPGYGYGAADADVEGPARDEMSKFETPEPDSVNRPVVSTEPTSSNASSANAPGTFASLPIPVRRAKTARRQTSIFATQEEELRGSSSSSETSPLLRRISSDHRLEDATAVVVHNYLSKPSLPLPLVIAHQIHLYVARCKRKGYLESIGPPGFGRLTQGVMTMTDLFGQIETLAMVKIPACYGIHLKQCTTLYLFALPLTLASGLLFLSPTTQPLTQSYRFLN